VLIVLTIIGVLAMRINLVVGGQKLPLTGNKFIEYVASGRDISIILGIAAAAVIVLAFLYSVLPMDRPGAQKKESNPVSKGVAQ
jgi:tetrathionate reductase subunit C